MIEVQTFYDHEAQVWVAESSNLPGLVTEAVTLDELQAKLPGLIEDLLLDSLPVTR